MTPTEWRDLERKLWEEKGPLVLFAVILREQMAWVASTCGPEDVGRWDLIISADWVAQLGVAQVTDHVSSKIRERFGARALERIARIIVLRPSDPLVKRILDAVGKTVEHKWTSLPKLGDRLDVEIAQAFVVTARKPASTKTT